MSEAAQAVLIVNYYLAGLKSNVIYQIFQYELFDEQWDGYDGMLARRGEGRGERGEGRGERGERVSRGEGRGESEMVLILNDRCGVPLWTVQTR